MTLIEYGAMTKHRKGERKADLGCKRDGGKEGGSEGSSPRKGRTVRGW